MISNFNLLVMVLSTIALFLYGLRSFSDEVRSINSNKFKSRLSRITNNRYSAFLLGTLITAIIQSSSAVSSMTVAMVDAGVISFQQSLAVLLGCNVGTTATAWLVTLKLENIGPYFIVLGTFISMMPLRWNLYGKSVFYFGFILFSLNLLSEVLATVQQEPWLVSLLDNADNLFLGVLMGTAATILLQSSSLVTGLIILLAAQQSLNIDSAIAIILGCNIGTTSTALLGATKMGSAAKRSATANLLFNAAGLILFLPFTYALSSLVQSMSDDIRFQVAWAHLIFNVVTALMILPFINRFAGWFWKNQKIEVSEDKAQLNA
jgi:phosphate:Na+ symporter